MLLKLNKRALLNVDLTASCYRFAPAMVYISSWQDFQEAAEALYEKSPTIVRNITEQCHHY